MTSEEVKLSERIKGFLEKHPEHLHLILSSITDGAQGFKKAVEKDRKAEAKDIVYYLMCLLHSVLKPKEFKMYLDLFARAINYCYPNGFNHNSHSKASITLLKEFCEIWFKDGRNIDWELKYFENVEDVYTSWQEYLEKYKNLEE